LFTTDHGGAALHTILPATPASVQRESSPAFAASRDRFERIVGWLEGRDSGQLAHGELEERLDEEGRELLRQMLQDHLDLRAQREPRLEAVVGADGVARGSVEAGHERGLLSVFGKVDVTRLAYRRRGHANLHPADSDLNLPVELHSHGLRRLAVLEGTRGSFDDVREAVRRTTGQRLGKRQLEALVQRAAADFDAFYEERKLTAGHPDDVLVISCDGKGVVMRPDALRAATAQAAARSTNKLATRLSKGEKRNRKRMAEVGGVYDARPVPRTSDDILAGAPGGDGGRPLPALRKAAAPSPRADRRAARSGARAALGRRRDRARPRGDDDEPAPQAPRRSCRATRDGQAGRRGAAVRVGANHPQAAAAHGDRGKLSGSSGKSVNQSGCSRRHRSAISATSR
jgi:hypothetical protein